MIIYEKLRQEGLRQVWLRKELKRRGHIVSRSSLCNIVRSVSLPRDLEILKDICYILSLDFEKCLLEYNHNRLSKKNAPDQPQSNGGQT